VETLASTRGANFSNLVRVVDGDQRAQAHKTASPRLWAAFELSGSGN